MAFGDYYPATTIFWGTCQHGISLGIRCHTCQPWNSMTSNIGPGFQMAGWTCPGCGCGFAPSLTQCPYCPRQQPPAQEDVTLSVDDECVPPEEGGTCAGGRHCSC